jgi:hypothetical protein
MTYRTGNHWGVTIVREAQQAPNGSHWHGGGPCEECPRQAELVAVVVNGDQALAERICALLNAEAASGPTALTCTSGPSPSPTGRTPDRRRSTGRTRRAST